MTARHITWALEQQTGTPTNKLVLVLLAVRASWAGTTDEIKNSDLARQAGVSRRQILRCINDLVSRKLIARGPEPSGSHYLTYRILAPTPAQPDFASARRPTINLDEPRPDDDEDDS